MKRRFVLAIDNATKEQQNVVTNYFMNQMGYWHWFSDAWLLTDSEGLWNVASIRDKVQELLPGVDMIVLRVESDTDWAGFGQTDKFKW
ncbi:MAG: hypothetical protein IH838_13265, partial [Proteobacteria bacterium]|nr:hypothetical protein [Pseudomonadota bacterium]